MADFFMRLAVRAIRSAALPHAAASHGAALSSELPPDISLDPDERNGLPLKRAGNGDPGVGERDPGISVPAASGIFQTRGANENVAGDRSLPEASGVAPEGVEPVSAALRHADHAPDRNVRPLFEHHGQPRPESVALPGTDPGNAVDAGSRFGIDAPAVLPRPRNEAIDAGDVMESASELPAQPYSAENPVAQKLSTKHDMPTLHDVPMVHDAQALSDAHAVPSLPVDRESSSINDGAYDAGTVQPALRGRDREDVLGREGSDRMDASLLSAGQHRDEPPAEPPRTSVIGTVRSAIRRFFAPRSQSEPAPTNALDAPDDGVPQRGGESAPRRGEKRSTARLIDLHAAVDTVGAVSSTSHAGTSRSGEEAAVIPASAMPDFDSPMPTRNDDGAGTEPRDRDFELRPPVRGIASESFPGRDAVEMQRSGTRAMVRDAGESKSGLARVRELIRSVVRPRTATRTVASEAVQSDGGSHRRSAGNDAPARNQSVAARAVVDAVARLTDADAAEPVRSMRDNTSAPSETRVRLAVEAGERMREREGADAGEQVVIRARENSARQVRERVERGVREGMQHQARERAERRAGEKNEPQAREHRSVASRNESQVRAMLDQVGHRDSATRVGNAQGSLQPARLHHSRQESMLHEKTSQTPARGAGQAPPVKISIGRIEVRAAERKDPPAPQPRATTRGPELSLSEYLKQRNREH